MAEQTRNLFFYSERSWTNPRTEIDIERVNIRPRKFYFNWIDKFWSIVYDKRKNKRKIRYNVIKNYNVIKKKNNIAIIYK